MKKLIIAVALCAASTANAQTAKEFAWLDKSKEFVKSRLKDPESAIFSNTHFYRGGAGIVVCGEVNSRNSFGGYTGRKRFITNGANLIAFDHQISDFHNAWRDLCK